MTLGETDLHSMEQMRAARKPHAAARSFLIDPWESRTPEGTPGRCAVGRGRPSRTAALRGRSGATEERPDLDQIGGVEPFLKGAVDLRQVSPRFLLPVSRPGEASQAHRRT